MSTVLDPTATAADAAATAAAAAGARTPPWSRRAPCTRRCPPRASPRARSRCQHPTDLKHSQPVVEAPRPHVLVVADLECSSVEVLEPGTQRRGPAAVVEGPALVGLRLERHALPLQGAPQLGEAAQRRRAGVGPVLHAVEGSDAHALEGHLRREPVGGRGLRRRPEGGRDPAELLAAGLHRRERLSRVAASLRIGQPLQEMLPQRPLCLQAALRNEAHVGAGHVHLGPLSAHRGVHQAGKAVVLQQRVHVVAVAGARREAGREARAAAGRVVEEAVARRAGGHKPVQGLPRRGIVLVVAARREHHGHAARQAHARGVGVDHQRGPEPQASLP
mmetsp:Transcript_61487/g.171704  ORF Transcript_61487/g.171704 Transcript_61487/m.171704 type:complete len:333 (+) Transcript_61487:245-1243(+)